MTYSLNKLYFTVGLSKQAVYQYAQRQAGVDHKIRGLIAQADMVRMDHPGCGVRKLYNTLKPDFIGRDRFVDTFMDLGYRLKRKKNYKRTTVAGNKYYPNAIKGLSVSAPSVIWQSDITYFPIGDKHYYAVFIIDVYTKKIVGYQVSTHMRASANMSALKKALKSHPAPQFHHSDRGGQYICLKYTKFLEDRNTTISMGLKAQDNAYAERINRTIKEEYLDHWKPCTFEQLERSVKKAVNNYNTKRPHNNLQELSPVEFELRWNRLDFNKRPEFKIYNDENQINNGQL